MKVWKLFLLMSCMAPLAGVAGEEKPFLPVALDQNQTITGANAELLLNALPPAKNLAFPGTASQAELDKHFRELVIGNADSGAVLDITCSSAAWEFQGHGRAGQFVLVNDAPTCTVQLLPNASEISPVFITLENSLGMAKAANALDPILSHTPILHGTVVEPVCHTRICD